MTNITWPEQLPQVLILNGMSAEKQDNVVRTSMDAGPHKTRRRYTVASKNFSGFIIITEGQRQILEEWYDTVIASGVLRFKMRDPQTLIISEFRFRERYSEESLDGLWKIKLALEKMNA